MGGLVTAQEEDTLRAASPPGTPALQAGRFGLGVEVEKALASPTVDSVLLVAASPPTFQGFSCPLQSPPKRLQK